MFLLKFLVSAFICQIQHCFRISKTNCPELERATNSNFRDEEILMPANSLNKAECQYGQRSLKTISCVCYQLFIQFFNFYISNFSQITTSTVFVFTYFQRSLFSHFFFTCYYSIILHAILYFKL